LGYDRAMRIAVLVLVALLGCKGKSKLDADRGADVDALWDLAPDGTELGVVGSARAVGLAFRAVGALRDAVKQPDFELAKPQLDALLASLLGNETATPEDAGFAKDRPFAMFVTRDGVLGVMPVGNRDKFMAAKKGTRGAGSADDTLETNTCREIGRHYVCVTQIDMFARIGKGSLRGKLPKLGARGDAELYMIGVPLLGQNQGALVLAAQLEPGQMSLHGRWLGELDGPLAAAAGTVAPKPDTNGVSGYATANLAPLLANVPSVPLAGGVTLDQLAKSLEGSVTAVIPSNAIDFQMFAPLADPKPAQTVIDNCKDIGQFFTLAEKQTAGACRIVLQGANALELDVWVDGKTLRLGAKKGPPPTGAGGALSPWGRELSAGTWSASTWGRGTMHNGSGLPAKDAGSPQAALGTHAMALLNEIGLAVRVEKDGVTFRLVARTLWANPPDVVADIIKIPGRDILAGKATEAAKQVAKRAPNTPFAADVAAGQGGLMVPLAMVSLVSGILLGPRVMSMFSDGELDDVESPPPMNEGDLVSLLLRAYVDEAYPKWQADHPKQKCPATLAEVAKYFGETPGLPLETDPWGHALQMKCDDKGFTVWSLGPDGKPDTADDVRP
jgi:hypothetical protein